jgi:CrcB protein
MSAVWVALGAAVGAPLRYLADGAMRRLVPGPFPWGTFVVNVVGSFVLGVVSAAGPSPAVAALVGVGFCGALTTYSTFALETFALAERRAVAVATVNVVGSVVVGVAAAAAGHLLGGALR